MTYSFTETRAKLFWHYLFRWYAVPRKTQRVIRYGIIVIFLFYGAAALFLKDFYQHIPFANAVHILIGVAVILPFVSAGIVIARFRSSTYELLIDDNFEWIKFQRKGSESTINRSEIKKVHATNNYVRVTLKTDSYDTYLYFFKNQTTVEAFVEVREKLLRLASKTDMGGETSVILSR